jgi:hypothetical protein
MHCLCLCVLFRRLQGSLRDALDCGLLSKPGSYLAPSVVLTLAHDVCAAMLHLHRSVVRIAAWALRAWAALLLQHSCVTVKLILLQYHY